jgi:hypothetical protein
VAHQLRTAPLDAAIHWPHSAIVRGSRGQSARRTSARDKRAAACASMRPGSPLGTASSFDADIVWSMSASSSSGPIASSMKSVAPSRIATTASLALPDPARTMNGVLIPHPRMVLSTTNAVRSGNKRVSTIKSTAARDERIVSAAAGDAAVNTV